VGILFCIFSPFALNFQSDGLNIPQISSRRLWRHTKRAPLCLSLPKAARSSCCLNASSSDPTFTVVNVPEEAPRVCMGVVFSLNYAEAT
jgi:hypothetical protein